MFARKVTRHEPKSEWNVTDANEFAMPTSSEITQGTCLTPTAVWKPQKYADDTGFCSGTTHRWAEVPEAGLLIDTAGATQSGTAIEGGYDVTYSKVREPWLHVDRETKKPSGIQHHPVCPNQGH